MTALMAAQELVDVRPQTAEYDGTTVTINTGKLLLHAVAGDDMQALCGTAGSRLLPTGWQWSEATPPHVARCSACTQRFSTSDG
jgi:hypothetical protein